MKDISSAIQARDFDRFASITMADSNNFHATCLDTTPPIFYMNDVSRAIVQLTEELNRASEEEGKGKIAAYTYDAGPNAVLYTPKEKVPLVLKLVRHYFPNADFDDTVSGRGGLSFNAWLYADPSYFSPARSSTSSAQEPMPHTAAPRRLSSSRRNQKVSQPASTRRSSQFTRRAQ